jgi:hypothetical protein
MSMNLGVLEYWITGAMAEGLITPISILQPPSFHYRIEAFKNFR